MKFRFALLAVLAASILVPVSGLTSDTPHDNAKSEAQNTPKKDDEKSVTRTDDDKPLENPIEDAQPHKRSIPFRGKSLAYTVTPGTLVLRNDTGEPIATMFYTAYTVDPVKGAPPRPLTFLFNGGPGSASMYLHLASYGPLKLDLSKVEVARPGPYPLRPNPDTLLDKTDLIFLDAVTTGLSRPAGRATGKDFWGVDQDIDAFVRGIQRYLTIYNRWQSPKFLLGESYGTMRAGGLVYALQEHGIEMTGVIVMSTVFTYGPAMDPGTEQIYVSYLPSYAAVAAYHNRLAQKPANLSEFIQQVRDFANGPYVVALQKGDDLSDREREMLAQQLSAFTGLSPQYILENDLRVDPSRFRKELLRSERRTVGRLDARFTAIDVDAGGEKPEYDAADAAFSAAFIASINDYLFNDLGYKSALVYRPSSGSMIGDKWDFTHKMPWLGRINVAVSTMPDLARAIHENPHLRVIDLNGYYDLATPFGGAEYDLKRILLDKSEKDHIAYRYYPSGHMIYINPVAAHQIQIDLDAFYDSALSQ